MSKKTNTKNHTSTPFYRVRITLRIPGYQSLLLEGMYLPKPGTEAADGKLLKRECLDYAARQIRWDDLGVTRDDCTMEVSYKALPNAFIVVEGKESE
jgi:hypothetical protein